MRFQIYWPAWWHLVPYYSCEEEDISEYAGEFHTWTNHTFCWSIFQFEWTS